MNVAARTTAEAAGVNVKRPRNKQQTLQELKCAILKVKDKGHRMSIAAVAQEAGVVPSTIHKVYPDIAEEIRVLVGRSTRQQRDQHYAELVKARQTIKELRTELQELQGDLARLASVNLELDELNTRLNAELAGKVVSLGARK